MSKPSPDSPPPVYFTARLLLEALEKMDESMLDLPLLMIHGKNLHKPNLVAGWVPAPTPVLRTAVESKNASLLTIAALVDKLEQPKK
ncbi:hypothetical protein [Lignipirellula cremea]|uniref:Uncharacterized protein n=1 Tax=Lignipirellula cremea TaxID=2528010 RepID=A0A518DPY8_9BACT|nr:hypothetical protein [Lignipirellula cremea]QDU93901.1 hypothetical protein Pla8534_16860 [Lignipirellula cremea]